MVWVVETGMPRKVAPNSVIAPPVSAQNPCIGVSLVIFDPMVLTIRQPPPNFAVKVLPDNPRINRGGHVPLRCELTRTNGFNETVRITISDLPPGLFAEPLLLTPAGPTSGWILISASESASLGAVPLKLAATTLLNGKEVSRAVEPLSGDKVVKAFASVGWGWGGSWGGPWDFQHFSATGR
jgi:hypothetical protein